MELREHLNVMEQRRDIFDDFRAGRTEIMLGILLLGTSFITGILVGLAIG